VVTCGSCNLYKPYSCNAYIVSSTAAHVLIWIISVMVSYMPLQPVRSECPKVRNQMSDVRCQDPKPTATMPPTVIEPQDQQESGNLDVHRFDTKFWGCSGFWGARCYNMQPSWSWGIIC
jgi:hypothetical protein